MSDKNITVTLGSDSEEKGRWPYAAQVEPLKKLATHEKKDVTVSFSTGLEYVCV